MALYVTDSANLRITVRKEEKVYTPKGDLAAVKPRIVVQFQRGGVPAWAEQTVLERLEWRGQDDSFERSTRTGVFDSVEAQRINGWTDDDRVAVEAFLDSHMPGNNFIRVEPPRLEAPWPSITNLTVHGRRTAEVVADKMLDTAREIGFDLNQLALYVAQETGSVQGWDAKLLALVREKIAVLESVPEPDEELVEA